ncbi:MULTISPECIES: hypothetical protein [Aeromicrobium]|nr:MULTISPECIES: hypothetical protein [Aeromicrobium]
MSQSPNEPLDPDETADNPEVDAPRPFEPSVSNPDADGLDDSVS